MTPDNAPTTSQPTTLTAEELNRLEQEVRAGDAEAQERLERMLVERAPEADQIVSRLLHDEDPQVLGALTGAYIEPMYRYLSRRYGSNLSSQDIEDILADTFLKVLSRGRIYDPKRSKPITWLLVEANYRTREFLRRQSKIREVPLEHAMNVPDIASSREKYAKETLVDGRFAEILNQIPPRQAEVVRLRMENLSFDIIAERLHISPGNARVIFYRAVEKLRNLVKSSPYTE